MGGGGGWPEVWLANIQGSKLISGRPLSTPFQRAWNMSGFPKIRGTFSEDIGLHRDM